MPAGMTKSRIIRLRRTDSFFIHANQSAAANQWLIILILERDGIKSPGLANIPILSRS